jgi:DNA-binding response OmpR family regulator
MMRLLTILLVDDEPDLLEVGAAILAEPRYTVLTAADGYEALRVLVDRVVDLMITDVRMPGISGFELARQAKLMRPSLHVIYLSGRASRPDGMGPTYGALVRKPVRAGELLAIVGREIGHSGAIGPTPGR